MVVGLPLLGRRCRQHREQVSRWLPLVRWRRCSGPWRCSTAGCWTIPFLLLLRSLPVSLNRHRQKKKTKRWLLGKRRPTWRPPQKENANQTVRAFCVFFIFFLLADWIASLVWCWREKNGRYEWKSRFHTAAVSPPADCFLPVGWIPPSARLPTTWKRQSTKKEKERYIYI